MCFAVIVGKDATVDGSVLLGTNNDWPGTPGHILYAPKKEYEQGNTFILTNGIEIPEAEETFSYTFTSTAYTTGVHDESWLYGVNDNQVAVSMMGVYAFKQIESENGLEADDLTRLVLGRGKTARQSIEMLGEIIKTYGFSVSSIDGAAGSVVLGIADPQEGYWFEISPGGHWVAKRVPDNMISARPNCFGIQEVDFNDPVNYMWSDNVANFAKEQGWYDDKDGKAFNFFEAYGDDSPINTYGKATDPVNAYRRWRAMNIASGLELPIEDLTYEIEPKEKMSARDIMDLLGDSSEGTKYDLSTAPEAGTYKNPFWMDVSSSIGQSGTVLSMVAQLRDFLPNEIGGLMWFSYANSHLSPFLPCYIGSHGMPKEYEVGDMLNFDLNSAWWVFQEVGQLCYRNYQEIAKKEVIPVFREMENKALEKQKIMEKVFLDLYNQNPELARDAMNTYTNSCAIVAMDTAKRLSNKIKGKYLANVIV